MNKIVIKCFCLLMILGLVGCRGREEVHVEIEEQIVPVTVTSVEDDTFYESVFALGAVGVSDVYQVTANVQGVVSKVYFEIGDTVHKGDVLFEVNMEDFEVDMQNKISQANNAVTQTKNNYMNAAENLEKTKQLYGSGISSKTELDLAETSHDNTRISYQNALDSYETLVYNYETQKEKFTVTSPVDGVVSQKNVLEDMQVSPQTGYTIDANNGLNVVAQVPSKYINDIQLMQRTSIFVPALNRVYSGYVDGIGQQGKNGTYNVIVAFEGDTADLLNGMFADVIIKTSDIAIGLWLPSNAILVENGNSYIYIVEEHHAKRIDVKVLVSRNETTAVEAELLMSDQVIVYGKEYLVDGSQIVIGE